MERVPFRICVTRLVGTFILRASSAALRSSASSSSARCSPGWIAAIAITILLVIIGNFHVGRPGWPVEPFKAQAPLIVNANAVLAFAVTKQGLKPIARQRGEISERCGRLQTVQLHPCGALKPGECLDVLPCGEVPRPLVPIADDHSPKITGLTRYVKRHEQEQLIPQA